MAYKSGHIYLIDHEISEEELANFTKPVQFDVCKDGLFYSIIYDKNGNKYVEDRSKIFTGFIKIGEIIQQENQISIGVHPSGFNHWRIGGVDITSDQPTVLEIDPVEDGEFRTDWIVGNTAGGIFILPGTAGKFPMKPNPLDYPGLAFFTEISVTPEGIGGLVELNLSDVFTGNAADQELNIKEASAENRGTMSPTHFSKLEGINPSLYATLAGLDAEIVNRAAGDNNLQSQVNTINSRASAVADKMLHYWDATAGKWLSSGVAYLSGRIGIGKTDPSEMLDVNGRAKANSLVLASDIGTAVPNEIGRKLGKIGFASADGIFREILILGQTYEHTIRGKRVVLTGTGSLDIDLNIGSHFSINATSATTVSIINMIAVDETCSITLTVTGSLITLPPWLTKDSYSDIPDASKTREYNIIIKRGGTSPLGRYTIINN